MIIYIPGEIKTITEFVLSELVDDLHHSLNIQILDLTAGSGER